MRVQISIVLTTVLLRDKAYVLWSLRHEGHKVHLHGLFLGLKTDRGGEKP